MRVFTTVYQAYRERPLLQPPTTNCHLPMRGVNGYENLTVTLFYDWFNLPETV